MNNDTAIKVLNIVGSVRSTTWDSVMKLVEYIQSGSADIIEKEWDDRFKKENPIHYPLDLSKIDTWSTYEKECIDLRYLMEDDKLICAAKIYNGNSFYGFRTSLRFTAKIQLPTHFLDQIKGRIESALNDVADDEYEKHLELQRKKWVEKFKSKIISNQ